MMGVRDVNVFPMYGTRKNAGDLGAPLFPTNGIPALVASIGADGGDYTTAIAGTSGYGVAAYSVSSPTTTLSAAVTQAAILVSTTAGSYAATVSGTIVSAPVKLFNFSGATAVISNGTTTITGTTLSTAALATGQAIGGVNQISVGASIAANSYIQVDTNNTSTGTTSEIRKVTAVSGSGPYTLTLDKPLYFTHLNGASVYVIGTSSSPGQCVHTILQGNNLPSLTIEKNIGGFQSLQFSGAKIDKYALKAEASDAAVSFTASTIAKSYTVLDTPNPISNIVNEAPFVFAEATAQLNFGYGSPVTVAQLSNISLDVENGLKPTYTFNQTHDLQFLTPLTRHISGQFDVVFTSLDDATWGYFNIMQNQIQGSLSLSFTHASTNSAISLSLPAINLAKYADALKLDDVVMTTLNFEAAYNIGAASNPSTINTTVTNTQYLPY
jgi:hypothetical protein